MDPLSEEAQENIANYLGLNKEENATPDEDPFDVKLEDGEFLTGEGSPPDNKQPPFPEESNEHDNLIRQIRYHKDINKAYHKGYMKAMEHIEEKVEEILDDE